MRYVKLFEEFNSEDVKEMLSELIKLMPGKREETGMSYEEKFLMIQVNTKPTPEHEKWLSNCKKLFSSAYAIEWVRKNYDDIFYGETEEELQSAINSNVGYEIDFENKFTQEFLRKPMAFARRNGYAFVTGFIVHPKSRSNHFVFEIYIELKRDEEAEKLHRGYISGKKFKF